LIIDGRRSTNSNDAANKANNLILEEMLAMKKRILVVDDAAIIRLMLTKIIVSDEYEVVGEAGNGAEAVQKYEELKPDLVTMDITMPDMDGIQAVKEIKKMDPNAKIIMCSAMGQKMMVLEAIEAGAASFIVKPFDEQKVKEVIKRTLS
jgi:two-component system chemotaxis response regulator CheY